MAPGSRRIAPRPINRDVASSILNYVREDDPRLSTLSEMRELRLESAQRRLLRRRKVTCNRKCVALPSMGTHACARVRYRRGLSRYWMADSWSSCYARAEKPRREMRGARHDFAQFHPLTLMRIANALANSRKHVAITPYLLTITLFNWTVSRGVFRSTELHRF